MTLGGGIGYCARYLGLTCDALVGARVVGSSGRLLLANEHENADLFWVCCRDCLLTCRLLLLILTFQALRGGGGNFGVCVQFEFAAAAVAASIPVARLSFDVENTAELLRVYADFTSSRASGRDGVSTYLFLSRRVNEVVVCNVAPSDSTDAAANVEVFRDLISPFVSLGAAVSLESMTLPELNSMGDAGNAAGRMYCTLP